MRALKRWLSLDWLFPPPQPEEVALRLEAALRARGIESLEADLPRGHMTGEHEGRSFHLNFANVYRDCLRAPRRQRYAVIQQVAQQVASGDAAVVPARYDAARARLMPVVRPTAELTAVVLSMGMPNMQAGPAHRPHAADLSVALVCDSPSAMSYVSWRQLAEWEVDFDTALGDALHNLRGLPEKQAWQPIAPGLWAGAWADAYKSSRLLLPDVIHRLGVPEPVALVPTRDTLLLTSARNAGGLAQMAALAQQLADRHAATGSFQPLRLEGRAWQPHDTPQTRPLFKALQEQKKSADYRRQKDLIERLHATHGLHAPVSAYQCFELGNGEPPISCAMWVPDMEFLLPPAEQIVFSRLDGDRLDYLHVRWHDVLDVAGALLEPTDWAPPLYRVRGYPDAGMLQRLRERAALP